MDRFIPGKLREFPPKELICADWLSQKAGEGDEGGKGGIEEPADNLKKLERMGLS